MNANAALAGPELNTLMAEKIMGWVKEHWDWVPADSPVVTAFEVDGDDEAMDAAIFDPSHRIDHAWLVREKILARGRKWGIKLLGCAPNMMYPHQEPETCTIYRIDDILDDTLVVHEKTWCGTADAAALAICRAAAMLIESEAADTAPAG